MAIGARRESNAMTYALITFVALFIVSTTVAVIYYVKAEEQRTLAESSQSDLEKLIRPMERQKGLGNIVGKIGRGKSGIGAMVGYLDEMSGLLVGGIAENSSAESKVERARFAYDGILASSSSAGVDLGSVDPNMTGMTAIAKKLISKVENNDKTIASLDNQLAGLQKKYDSYVEASLEKEDSLLAEKESYHNQIKEIEKSYSGLKKLLEQTSEEKVTNLFARLERETINHKETNEKLLKVHAQLRLTEGMMQRALEDLRSIEPVMDSDVAAYKPDARVILVDNQTKIVHLNVGSDDRVYPGLTFSIYDRSVPIPKDGKGKAEIEVYDVDKNISAARIIRSEIKNPVVIEDIVANLIWDSDKENEFVISGDFDLNYDGEVDYEAVAQIEGLVRKWGGKIAANVSINTDFVVLGQTPKVRKKPTFDELEVYPMAMERYEKAREKLVHYTETKEQSQALSLPLFNYERFLYFIGYKSRSSQAGSF